MRDQLPSMDIPMHTDSPALHAAPLARPLARAPALALAAAMALGLAFSTSAQALDFGPFTLTGFAKAEAQRGSNHCPNCGVNPGEDKQRVWADPVVFGSHFGSETTHVTLVQPWLGVKFDLPKGFKVGGLISQRWRDGKLDIPGFWYDKNVYVSQDDWGSVRVGSMTSRTWSVADYPYGTNIGVADVWGSSGAGYGLLGHAVRVTTRTLDVLNGDLVLEATHDKGTPGWVKNKPRFLELYAQYHKGDLVVDAMYQDTRNGTPSAWSHGPFTGLTPFPADDRKLGSSGQSIAMVMGRYQLDVKFEVSAGLRRNRWSGAYAAITQAAPGQPDQWNNMFNVDWNCSVDRPVRCSIANPGYPARSTDLMLGLRYRTGPWSASTGLAYLGKASTANPSERGQSNDALVNTLGLNYDFGNGLQVYGLAGMVRYGRLGLSPLSMPGNAAFTNVDSRISTHGNWFGAGAVFVF